MVVSIMYISSIGMDIKRGSVIFFYVVMTVLIKEFTCTFTGNTTGWYTSSFVKSIFC